VTTVPAIRIHPCNEAGIRFDGEFVLYWMIWARRTHYSFALDRALEHCRSLRRPLVVLEALRADYPYASERLHAFAIEGMAGNARRFGRTPVHHYPYVEPGIGEGRGLLELLGSRACVVVTDEFPEFFLPRMVDAAAARLSVRLERVDGIGLLPLRAAPKAFTHAQHFRRHLQRELPRHLDDRPKADPLRGSAKLPGLPKGALADIEARFPPATDEMLAAGDAVLRSLPIDHDVPRVDVVGGMAAAEQRLRRFLDGPIDLYALHRNRVEEPVNSGLSPYLHWGFISPHRILDALAEREGWHEGRLAPAPTGGREGWWGMSPGAEAFLDELITWRELTHNTSFHLPDHTTYGSLPAWARATLEKHAADPRPALYTLSDLESARTHDPLWNATQRELRREGRIHSYLRMVWGKCILSWTHDPAEAIAVMSSLNDRWALDGRDPNSWGGILWCLGRYDRAWGPERPVFGTVRFMSTTATARKLRIREYLERYGS